MVKNIQQTRCFWQTQDPELSNMPFKGIWFFYSKMPMLAFSIQVNGDNCQIFNGRIYSNFIPTQSCHITSEDMEYSEQVIRLDSSCSPSTFIICSRSVQTFSWTRRRWVNNICILIHKPLVPLIKQVMFAISEHKHWSEWIKQYN